MKLRGKGENKLWSTAALGCAGFHYFAAGRFLALITIARSPLRVLVNRSLIRPSSSSVITAGVLIEVSIHPAGSVT
jgi:hypothetical protein